VSPRSTLLLALAAAAILDGCACDSVPDAAVTSCEMSAVVQGAVMTDILFVVDDSGSMSQEHVYLGDALAGFVATLASSPVASDFRIALTTTSVTDFAGTAVGAQGCFVGPWLPGSSPTVTADFQAQIASIGTGGSGKEQPFRAMELALTTPALAGCTNNDGFLRPGARLAVIFVTDEDDCSDSGATRGIPGATTTTGNDQCHNDAGDGVDYKFTRIDSIDHYASFLSGAIGVEVRDVVVSAIAGVDAATLAPTCGNTANSWCCGGTADTIDTCTAGSCSSFSLTLPAAPPSLTGAILCCGGATGTACTSPCSTAYDKADRFAALLARFPPSRTLTASVCDSSFATSLERIAGLIVSPTLPLEGAPADYRMLGVTLEKASGTRVTCTVGLTPGAADAVYVPPTGDAPASLTFQVAAPGDGDVCKLGGGDQIRVAVICAG
jgi:hypothetical protein